MQQCRAAGKSVGTSAGWGSGTLVHPDDGDNCAVPRWTVGVNEAFVFHACPGAAGHPRLALVPMVRVRWSAAR